MPLNSLTNVPQSVMSRAITQNFSQEEQTRRENMRLNRDFYYGKQKQTIQLVNEDQDPRTLNLTYPVIKKKAGLLYSTPPVREFDGPSSSISFIEELYKENKVDQLLLQADLNAELTGSSLITLMQDESKNTGFSFRMYDASAVSPLSTEDDSSKLDALSLVREIDRLQDKGPGQQMVQRILKQQIWTEDYVSTYEGEVLKSTESNELGFIPFVNFKGEEVYDQYLGHAPGTGIRELNHDINMLLTDLGMVIKFQAFTPVFVTGYSGDTLVTLHPGRALNLPAGAKAGVLGVNPSIKEIHEFIVWLEEKCYETNSVPKISVVGGGEAKSGIELIIRWFPLLQVFEEKSVRYQQYELELANLCLKVNGMPEVEDVKVNYNRESVLPVSEEEETLKDDIEMNIKTPADEVMRRNPELSETEAEAIVLANRDFNDQLRSSGNDQGNRPEEQGQQDEPESEQEPGSPEETSSEDDDKGSEETG